MRHLPFTFGILVAAAAMGGPARAQNYPWCAQYSGDFGDTMNCGFVSVAQCMATVTGIGGFGGAVGSGRCDNHRPRALLGGIPPLHPQVSRRL